MGRGRGRDVGRDACGDRTEEDVNALVRDDDDMWLYSDGDVGANREVEDESLRWVYTCCEGYETLGAGEDVAGVGECAFSGHR